MVREVLKKFLCENMDFQKPILLALSGGPDSMVLFHLLVELKIDFAVAHVNHNWRVESTDEAAILEQMADAANIPFHLSILNPQEIKGNLELGCRLLRLSFFRKLCEEFAYQAVIMGHHLDDQAETLLKRLFEGASLNGLCGLKKMTMIDDLKIFRPLLTLRKKEIEAYVQIKKIDAFYDKTNQDPKFMRARFRSKIIPFLNEEFKKDIAEPLYRLGNEVIGLNDYLLKAFAPHKAKIVKSKDRAYFDFSSLDSAFEIKYFIRLFAKEMGFIISHSIVETILSLIEANTANKWLFVDKKHLFIDRKKMFVFGSEMQEMPLNLSLEIDTTNCGSFNFGFLKVILEEKPLNNNNLISWQNVFKGFVQILIPTGSYQLVHPKNSNSYKTLSSSWSNYKVPAFLRNYFPVLSSDNEFCLDFLTGKQAFSKVKKLKNYQLTIREELEVDDEKRI